jgi:biopolymer transport protein ExbD
MAQLELQPASAGHTRRRLPASLRIDMTPMVDLGFLLITFFIFTATMSEPRTMNLAMPKEAGDSLRVKESRSLTIILGSNNKVFAYEGMWDDAQKNHRIIETGYDVNGGIGKLIREKQQKLQASDKEGRDALTLMIKPASQASYENLIDALDETLINDVKRYAIVDPTLSEKEFIAKEIGSN